MTASGVAEDRNISGLRHGIHLRQDAAVRLASRRRSGNAQAVGKSAEHDGFGHHLHVPLHQIGVSLGIDFIEELKILDPQSLPVAHGLTAVGGIQAVFPHVGAGETASAELCAGGRSQIDGGDGVFDHIHAEGQTDLRSQASDEIGHGGDGGDVRHRLIGQAELVGKQDPVHAAVLQRRQIRVGVVQHFVQAAAVPRIPGQRVQMQQRDNGFLHPKHFMNPHIHSSNPYTDGCIKLFRSKNDSAAACASPINDRLLRQLPPLPLRTSAHTGAAIRASCNVSQFVPVPQKRENGSPQRCAPHNERGGSVSALDILLVR